MAVHTESESAESGPIHTCKVHVRWSDFDRFGHLNNLSYIELAQEARNMFAFDEFIGRGLPVPAVFVRTLEADYLAPMMPDTADAEVVTEVTKIGRTSFTTRQEIKDRKGKTCAVVTCVQVAVDVATSTPREITDVEIKALTGA